MLIEVILAFCTSILFYCIYQKIIRRKQPPGPMPLPFIGNLLELVKVGGMPCEALYKLSKKYGSIYSLTVGVVPTVVVNGSEAIKYLINTQEFDNRIEDEWVLDRLYGQKLGIVFSEGDYWKNVRQITTKILKEFGFGKKQTMEHLICAEFEQLILKLKQRLKKNDNRLIVDGLFNGPMLNVIWSLIAGERFDLDEPDFQELSNALINFMRAGQVGGCSLLGAFPFLGKYLPGVTGFGNLHNCAINVLEFLEKAVQKQKDLGHYKTNPNNFIDVFLQEIENNKDWDPNGIYTDKNLVCIIYDMFLAGSDTTANALAFAVRLLVQYPKVQAKIRTEISVMVGKERAVTMEDKPRLRYTDATMLEILRYSNVVPIGPRRAAQTTQVGKYEIRKGTTVVVNYYSAHVDKLVWQDPENFRPERFLNEDREIINADKLIAFGQGKRNCIGEVTGRTALFVGMCTLVQNFIFEPDPSYGVPVVSDAPGFSTAPKPFHTNVKIR